MSGDREAKALQSGDIGPVSWTGLYTEFGQIAFYTCEYWLRLVKYCLRLDENQHLEFLGAQDYSRQAKNKLGIVAVLYLIQGHRRRFSGRFCRFISACTAYHCAPSVACACWSFPIL